MRGKGRRGWLVRGNRRSGWLVNLGGKGRSGWLVWGEEGMVGEGKGRNVLLVRGKR